MQDDWDGLFLVAEHVLGDEIIYIEPISLKKFTVVSINIHRLIKGLEGVPRDAGTLTFLLSFSIILNALTPYLLVLVEILTGVRTRTLLKLPITEALYLLDTATRVNAESREYFFKSTSAKSKKTGDDLGAVFDILVSRGYQVKDIRNSSLAQVAIYIREAILGRERDNVDRIVTVFKGTNYRYKDVVKEINSKNQMRSKLNGTMAGKEDPKFVNDEWKRLKQAFSRLH